MYYLSWIYEKLLLAMGHFGYGRLHGTSFEAPVFIVSAGRSGSTLLRKFLLLTGQFNIPPESGDLLPGLIKTYMACLFFPWRIKTKMMIRILKRNPDIRTWELDLGTLGRKMEDIPTPDRNMATLIYEIYHHYAVTHKLANYRFWGDKTPYLALRIPWIYLVFPKARIIHIVRDPRAVVVSRKKAFGDSMDYAIKRWKWAVKCIRESKKRHEILEIKYENLIKDTSKTISDVMEFISGDPSYIGKYKDVYMGDDHLRHHENLDKPILKNKISEWEQQLTGQDKAYIEKKLNAEMAVYGYET